MDQRTPYEMLERAERKPKRRRALGRAALAGPILIAIGGAAAVGYRLGEADWHLPPWVPPSISSIVGAAPEISVSTGPVIYYRDPDGNPFYSAGPKRTADGRDFLPVRASEDVSFDDLSQDSALADVSPPGEDGRRIVHYRNPMGLPDTSPVPKKDSMGMDYIPVYEGGADESVVNVSPGRLQRTGVRTEIVARRPVSRPIRAPGTIQLDERRISVVAMRTDAFVEEVASVTTGERVAKGQPLVRLYSPEIAAAGAQYLTDLNGGIRGAATGGARQRLENLGVPTDAIAEIERSGKAPLGVTWPAPSDGVVLERNVVAGMRAEPGDVLFRLADVTVVWALVDLSERDLPLIEVGQAVAVRPRGYVDRVFTGEIALIYPQINTETRTGRVRIELANAEGLLLPDMYVDAEIATGGDEPVIAVPASAVIDSGDRQVVIVDKGEGRLEPREVKLGRRGGDLVEVLEGVVEGDAVVAAGNFLIDAESNLKAALRGLAAPEQTR